MRQANCFVRGCSAESVTDVTMRGTLYVASVRCCDAHRVEALDEACRLAAIDLPIGMTREESAQVHADAVRAARAARGWPAPSDTLRLPALDEAVRKSQSGQV